MWPIEAIGPAITAVVWIVLIVKRAAYGFYFAEAVAIGACVVTLQLLLDLRMRYLGDVVIGALHLLCFAVLFRIRCKGARRRDHEQL